MKLSIIMYHYVRELRASRYPEIKGLETDQFREQIRYIKKYYNVISGDDLLAAAEAGSLDSLPPSSLLLTFDDGYLDHFTQVFPILCREKISGCFFPPAKTILEHQVLDVNKIHFVLASVLDKQVIVDHIFQMLDEYRGEYEIQSNDEYWNQLAVPSRYDPKEIVFIKRLLQRALPEELRAEMIDALFQKHVSADEAAFARELYMSADQMRCMIDNGMYFGSHGYGHYWLNTIDAEKQKYEIEQALAFLGQIGSSMDRWMMCYPYGAYDDSLLSVLKSKGCQVGLATTVGIADLARDDLLTLPRLNTNDLPKQADAPPNEWTLQAKGDRPPVSSGV